MSNARSAVSGQRESEVAFPDDYPETRMLSLALPAGSYVVTATFRAFSRADETVAPICGLRAGNDRDERQFNVLRGSNEMVSMQVAPTLATAGTVDLRCTDFGLGVSAIDTRITAVQVGSLSKVGLT